LKKLASPQTRYICPGAIEKVRMGSNLEFQIMAQLIAAKTQSRHREREFNTQILLQKILR